MASPVRFKMELKGHREAMAKYATLDRKMRRVIATKAVRAGAKVMVRALRYAVPGTGKAARKALGTKIKTYRGSQITVAISGERIATGRKDKEQKSKWGGPHLHLIEYGTQERFWTGERQTRKSGIAQGAFGEFRGLIRAAQQRSRIAAGIGMSPTKRALREAGKIGWLKARSVLAAIRGGRPTGRVRAKPFFLKAIRHALPVVQITQLGVLRREIEAAARAA